MTTISLSEADLSERYRFAIALARRTGAEAARIQRAAGPDELGISIKGQQDFVTEVDKRTEADIKKAIASSFPDDGVIGEESGGKPVPGPIWVIDPIDGTSNFMRGLTLWGVSIALVEGDRMLIGAIYDATTDRIFHALSGGGAFADETPIAASRVGDPQRGMVLFGHSRRTPTANYLEDVARISDMGFDARRLGAATIGLLRIADGSAEVYYEAHLNCWDVLAGALIAQEAGVVVKMPAMSTMLRDGGPVLAMAPGCVELVGDMFDGANIS